MNVKRMWLPNSKGNGPGGRRGGRNGLVAVAIDKDKSSQNAIKWAIENLLTKGQVVILIHVIQRASVDSCVNNYAMTGLNGAATGNKQILDKQARDLFVRFHCFCTRKDIQCFDVVLEDTDIAKAITEYVAHAAIENLVLGSSRHGFIRRLKTVDVPTNVSKGSPDFCTVYVISKTKISSVRNASRVAPFTSPLMPQIQQMMEQANGNTTTLAPLQTTILDTILLPRIKNSLSTFVKIGLAYFVLLSCVVGWKGRSFRSLRSTRGFK